jgi:hypothetical protein
MLGGALADEEERRGGSVMLQHFKKPRREFRRGAIIESQRHGAFLRVHGKERPGPQLAETRGQRARHDSA